MSGSTADGVNGRTIWIWRLDYGLKILCAPEPTNEM